MGVLPHDRMTDLTRLGGALVASAAIILAIRTARREPQYDLRDSNRDWDAEIKFAVELSTAVLGHAIARHAEFFPHVPVKFTDGIVPEDIAE